MPNIHNTLARIFFDVHYNASSRPALSNGDIYIDKDGLNEINQTLFDKGWYSLPSTLRPGWASRSTITELDTRLGSMTDYTELPNGDHICAISAVSILKSYNGGQSHQPVFPAGTLRSGTIIGTSNDGKVAIGTSSGNLIYLSSDFGDNFVSSSYGFTLDTACVTINPEDSNIILAGGRNGSTSGRMLRSTDGGITWNDVMSLNAGHMVSAISFIDETNVLAASYHTSTRALIVYKSTDSGATWTQNVTAFAYLPQLILFKDAETAVIIGVSSTLKLRVGHYNFTTSTYTDKHTSTGTCYPSRAYYSGGTIYLAGSNLSEFPAVLYSEDDGVTWVTTDKSSIQIGSSTSRAVYYNHLTDFVAVKATAPTIQWFTSNQIDTYSLKVGLDHNKRIAYMYAGYDNNTLEPISIDLSQRKIIELNLLIKEYPTSTNYLQYFACFFVDANGKPISVSANIGVGTQSYIGFALELDLLSSNVLVARRLVAVRGYPAITSSSDSFTLTVDTLIEHISDFQVTIGRFINARVIKDQQVFQLNMYGQSNQDVDYSNLISRSSVTTTQTVLDFIFNNRVTYGILGIGGVGTNTQAGKISNYSMKVL